VDRGRAIGAGVSAVSDSADASNAKDRVVDRLLKMGSNVHTSAGRLQAQCPAHADQNPSLSITQTEGAVLMYYHAGCDTGDVLSTLGMTRTDLHDDGDRVTYRCDYGRRVVRRWDKKFTQLDTHNPPELYRVTKVVQAVADGADIYVVEGEKDVHAVEAAGGVATCCPSTTDIPTASALLGRGANLGYQLAAAGEFAVRVLWLGRKLRVPTADLLVVSGLSADRKREAPNRNVQQPPEPTSNAG
jgi:hypothetical protein